MATAYQRAVRDKRRLQVAELYLRRLRQVEIAELLEVDQGTISRDIAYLRKRWQREAQEGLEGRIGQELAELTEMDREAALRFTATKKRGWLETRLKIKRRIAEMLGLDAAFKVHLERADDGLPKVIEIYLHDFPGGEGEGGPAPGPVSDMEVEVTLSGHDSGDGGRQD